MSEKTGSRILYPFKIIGLVCGKRRLCLNQLGTDTFITVPVGKAFQVYNTKKLQLIMVSPQLSEDITAIEVEREMTFTAVGNDVYIWRRFTITGCLKGEHGNIVCLLRIGDYLVTASEDGFLCIWNWYNQELIRTINLGSSFSPSVLAHPDTYLNKILVGGSTGKLQLWNIRTGSLIMNFKGYGSGITTIQQTPSVDVMAIGLADGTIDIMNLKYDETVMQFHQSSTVTALSFFSNMSKAPILLSGGENGHLCIWDIKEKRLRYEMEGAHEGSIHSAIFLPNLFQVVSGGTDNSLKIWAIDEIDYIPRLLKSREGHTQSSALIQFYGYHSIISRDDNSDGLGMNLLSAGMDRAFRSFHVIREQLAMELSQAPYSKRPKMSRVMTEVGLENTKGVKRLPVIVSFAYSEGRDRDWSNMVTCHENTTEVYTWKFLDKTMSEKVLTPPEAVFKEDNYALCCDLSNSGEIVVVGYRQGDIHVYNIQSGLYRGSLPREAKKGFIIKQSLLGYVGAGAQEEGEGKHTDAVICVGIDILNSHVVSVSKDHSIRFWDLDTRLLQHCIQLEQPVCKAVYSRNTGLLAVALQDSSVLLYDCSTYSLIRRFPAAHGPITSICFNDEGRWLLIADEAKQLRVFDIPNNRLIDWVEFEKKVESIAISYNDEFIATSHEGQVGISLWANNSYYQDLMLEKVPSSPIFIDKPSVEDQIVKEVKADEVEAKKRIFAPDVVANTIQLSHDPHTKWSSLSNLELIKERNKPIEPPKQPEQAPFFLSTIPGLTPQFTVEKEEKEEVSRFVKRGNVLKVESTLQKMLKEAREKSQKEEQVNMEAEDVETLMGPYFPVLEHFRQCSVAAAEAELSMLCMGPFDEVGKKALLHFFYFLKRALEVEVDYEMIQALLDRCLQLYSDLIPSLPEMKELLVSMQSFQETSWKRLQGLMQQSLCLVELFSNIQL